MFPCKSYDIIDFVQTSISKLSFHAKTAMCRLFNQRLFHNAANCFWQHRQQLCATISTLSLFHSTSRHDGAQVPQAYCITYYAVIRYYCAITSGECHTHDYQTHFCGALVGLGTRLPVYLGTHDNKWRPYIAALFCGQPFLSSC